MSSLSETLQSAVQHHQTGELDRAERLYRDIIRLDPQHSDALHLLGLVAHQRNNSRTAVDYITRAISINDSFPPYHGNLAAAYIALGQYEDAKESYRRAAAIAPEYFETQFSLGDLYFKEGSFDEAIECFEKGLQMYRQQRWQAAIDLFQQALATAPDDGPSRVLIERCKAFQTSPPPANWEGVFVMTEK